MDKVFFWNGDPIPFEMGQTVALALQRAGITEFGNRHPQISSAVFCGIGLCQNCRVEAEGGRSTEACLLLCTEDLQVRPIAGGPANG